MVDKIIKHIGRGLALSNDFIASRAKGCWVWDTEGRKYLDFTSGIGVLSTGHCHPRIVKAVQDQVGRLVHHQINIGRSQPLCTLIQEMVRILPDSLDSIIVSTTGAEAVENAIKLARHYTKKQNILCCTGSYHGRSNATAACTSSKVIYRESAGPFMPGVFFFPHPYHRQMPRELENNSRARVVYCLQQLELLLQQQSSPSDTAALIIEPILGEGGYVIPPKEYLEGISKICKKNGILFIIDEVQTGFGRTGQFFAYKNEKIFGVNSVIEPDILVMAKGIASGFPLSAIASRREITNSQPPMSMGGTYAGNVVSCRAAIETIRIIESENLLDNCTKMGERLEEKLNSLDKKRFSISEVRGEGLMQAIEFKEKGIASKIVKKCASKGLLLLTASIFDVIRIIPPLNVRESEIDHMFDILLDVLSSEMK